ncbi:hypothetical protein EV131_110169 [Rhizobium laguerreae]|uniref:Uncharacterized protein n=1 Tax=Rhizobium laguerreae TaxID=1076926 RepID=A0AAX2QGK3_9HYPH|nr:hypothetical protein EV131_110169 [Rhizobium laguerreae]
MEDWSSYQMSYFHMAFQNAVFFMAPFETVCLL